MTDYAYPRVTKILADFGFIAADSPWYHPKHRRRGRYVDHWSNQLAMSRPGPDDAWYGRRSGDPAQQDEVQHEECRPYIDAYVTFLVETGFKVTHCALEQESNDTEVRNTTLRYVGHFDQIGDFPMFYSPTNHLIDLKTGDEPPKDSPTEWYHRYQLALYQPAIVETLGLYCRRYNVYLMSSGKYRLVERKERSDLVEAAVLAQAWRLTFGRRAAA